MIDLCLHVFDHSFLPFLLCVVSLFVLSQNANECVKSIGCHVIFSNPTVLLDEGYTAFLLCFASLFFTGDDLCSEGIFPFAFILPFTPIEISAHCVEVERAQVEAERRQHGRVVSFLDL